jgi:hypothetical protein
MKLRWVRPLAIMSVVRSVRAPLVLSVSPARHARRVVLVALCALASVLAFPAPGVAQSQPHVTIGSVQGDFYPNPSNSGSFDTSQLQSKAFSQTFPVIDFNPPASAQVACSNSTGVDENTRPFTDVVPAGGTCSTVIAQGNGQQAGVGNLGQFEAVFSATLTIDAPGQVTFNFFSDDGWMLGAGQQVNGTAQPTYVSGAFTGAPTGCIGQTCGTLPSPVHSYTVVGAYNTNSSPTQQQVTVNFPSAGTYPIEVDYTECCGGQLALTLGTTAGNPILPGMSGPVAGFGDSIAAGYGLSSAAEWNVNFLNSRFPGGDTGCDLTPPAYPCVLADSANGTLNGSHNYSIQGASSDKVLGTELPLAEKNSAAERAPVRTVTLTVGADDIDFSGCLSDEFQFKTDHCLAGSINGGLRVSTSTAQHLRHLASNLQQIFKQIHTDFPNASLVVTGYYQPFPPPASAGSDACGLFAVPALAALQTYLHNLPQFELEFQTRFYIVATFLQQQLNRVIQNAANVASNAGLPISYVDIGPEFDGHDLCKGGQAWVEAPRLIADIAAVINVDSTFGTPKCEYPAPAVVGSEVNKTIFHGSLGFAIFYSNCIPHPIARGQQAIADAIASG